MDACKRLLAHPAAAPGILILAGLLIFGPHVPRAGLNHAETHFWLVAVAQNLLSTT